MTGLVQSELLKTKRSFARWSVLLMPLFAVLLASVLIEDRFVQACSLNWWCVIMLPAVLPIVCAALICKEQKMSCFNTAILPAPQKKTMLGKLAAGWIMLLGANAVLFLFTVLAGYFFESQFSVLSVLTAAAVLTLAYAWQVPACLLLIVRTGPAAGFFISLAVNAVCSSQPAAGSSFWIIPFAVPVRLLAPILGINPNGVPLEAASPLWNPGVILPGILIVLAAAVLFAFLACRWSEKRGIDQ